jgi:hypothetical protein
MVRGNSNSVPARLVLHTTKVVTGDLARKTGRIWVGEGIVWVDKLRKAEGAGCVPEAAVAR